MKRTNRMISGWLSVVLLAAMISGGVAARADDLPEQMLTAVDTAAESSPGGYAAYLQEHDGVSVAAEPLSLADAVTDIPAQTQEDTPVWRIENGAAMSFTFTAPADGMYSLTLPYLMAEEGVVDGCVTARLDGKSPYDEAQEQTLTRLWKNDGEIRPDSTGNDIRPDIVEVREWQTHLWRDPVGRETEDLRFCLTAGTHTLTLVNLESAVLIKAPVFSVPAKAPTYAEYQQKYAGKPVYSGDTVVIEAENTDRISSRSLISANDMSSALTTPYDPYYIRLNTLSGNNWRYIYDRVDWKVTVPAEGLYRMSFRFMQNFYNGLDTHRRLYINGEVPFEEVSAIDFAYDTSWQVKEAGEYLYYFHAGENTVSLEVVLGKYAEILRRVEEITLHLNGLYRRIIMVTGTTPDVYRDYNLDKEVPGLMEEFTTALANIRSLVGRLKELTGVEHSSELSTLEQLEIQIQDVLDKPASLTKGSRLGRFSSNISSLGAWINKLREQPLLLDSVSLLGKDTPTPRADAGFFRQLSHKFKRFRASFTMDYTSMGGQNGEDGLPNIRVWVFSGRDQAQLLKDMVDSNFTPRDNVRVTVELVSGGLIEAMLAGKGPDVALGRAENEPVDFAMRKAVMDLSGFDGFDEVCARFAPGTMNSYEYSGGYYAIPETQAFSMMFVRTDIFDELGLTVPTTWQELIKKDLPILQQFNMQAGIGALAEISDNTLFTNLLYQMGGKLYSSDRMTAALDTQVAYDAFETAVQMYRDYGVPTAYDALNRFRTGEMPLVLSPYTMYNNLDVAAPEISGLWEMYEVPGVLGEDGTIINTQIMGSGASVISSRSKKPEESWKFLKWWSAADTQVQYGNSLEAILGAGGRYTPANMEALRGLPWGSKQLAQLESQRSKNAVLPQLPGSYFTKRAVFNAFYSTVVNDEIPREQLLYWNEEINLELERKRQEFDFVPTKEDA